MKRPSRSSTDTGTVTSEALTRTTSSSPTSSETSPRLRCAGTDWPACGSRDVGKGVGAVLGAEGALFVCAFVVVCAGALCPTRRGRTCAKTSPCAAAQKARSRAAAVSFLMISAPKLRKTARRTD